MLMREAYAEKYNSNIVNVICQECGYLVEFTFKSGMNLKLCINKHSVVNNIEEEIISPEFLNGDKYCSKCGDPMKLVSWKGKKFWGCSNYSKCKTYQRFNTDI